MSSFLLKFQQELIIIKKEKRIIKLSIFSFFLYIITMMLFEGIIYTIAGIGFLSFLGFQYSSYFSAIIFFILCYIMLLPVNYYISFLIGLFKAKSNITFRQQRCIDFILYLSFSTFIVGLVDYIMDSIIIIPANQILFVVLCYLLDVYSDYLILSIISKN